MIQLGLGWGQRVYLSNVCPDYTDIAHSKPTFESQGPRAKPIAIRGKNCFALIETQ